MGGGLSERLIAVEKGDTREGSLFDGVRGAGVGLAGGRDAVNGATGEEDES